MPLFSHYSLHFSEGWIAHFYVTLHELKKPRWFSLAHLNPLASCVRSPLSSCSHHVEHPQILSLNLTRWCTLRWAAVSSNHTRWQKYKSLLIIRGPCFHHLCSSLHVGVSPQSLACSMNVQNAVSEADPSLWNNLPNSIRCASHTDSFKGQIKAHFFSFVLGPLLLVFFFFFCLDPLIDIPGCINVCSVHLNFSTNVLLICYNKDDLLLHSTPLPLCPQASVVAGAALPVS